MYNADGLIAFAEQVCEIHCVRGVRSIRIEGPFDVTDSAPICRFVVVTAVRGQRNECLLNHVRHNQQSAAAFAMGRCGFQGQAKIVLVCHVHDCVMNKDGIKRPPEAQGPHVALNVFALRIQFPAQLEHTWRKIHERHFEMGFQV